MGQTIDIVMIGCGNFSRRYHVPAIEADADAAIVAIYDPVPSDGTRQLALAQGAVLVADLDDLPATSRPTVAIVTTPHTLHFEHVRFALARGWHVLCDKPFVMQLAEAKSLAAEAKERQLINAVAFNRRFDRGCLRARAALAAGEIGQLRFIQTIQLGYERAGWFLDPALGGGGPYTGRASHMADLLPWLVGHTPDRIRSRLRGDGGPRSDQGGFIELRFGELEAQLTCIEEGWHMWDEVRLFGDDGLIELRRPLTIPLGWEFRMTRERGRAYEQLDADQAVGAALVDFLRAVRGGGRPECSFADAALSVEIVEAAFASARSGEAWRELGQ
ncbi:Gfo/Idh/MocA family oxidoreductase [Bosea vestrisii]|uniref:Gfo/Idh/MocA family protein n=1 Tax=Bosea vestrisii TaxID=151416 RepID=UPI0024DFFD76|nr:Gfo/Idh/MocA family oxidoreductase [Bosea vestrisii]WID95121.1 Gfo/Idh/MocA family oxidoreductase [Bosea vestrisii]